MAQALELPLMISDNMILQRDKPVRIWGWSSEKKVTVKFNGQTVDTDVTDGKWMVNLKPMQHHSKPLVMDITDGKDTKALQNILIGDVFFCAGQSNMEMRVTHSNDCKEIVKTSQNAQIRVCSSIITTAKTPQLKLKGFSGWHEASPASLAVSGVLPKRGFSGTAYSFARALHEQTNIPVGVMVSAWGGTTIEAFTDKETLAKYTNRPTILRGAKNVPSEVYNALVHPFTNFEVAGFVWYQGESNVSNTDYDHKVTLLRDRWRTLWNDNKKPFYMVQICPFNYGKKVNIEAFWKQQIAVAESDPLTHIARTEDIGNLKDIHPHNKKEVGSRLAALAAKQLKKIKK